MIDAKKELDDQDAYIDAVMAKYEENPLAVINAYRSVYGTVEDYQAEYREDWGSLLPESEVIQSWAEQDARDGWDAVVFLELWPR